MSLDRADVVIVGAGLAGASTAFFLSRTRGLSVVVLERETRPGVHSSGRNASLVRARSGDPDLDSLTREGADFLCAPPADFPERELLHATGSCFVAREEEARALARRTGLEVLSARELRAAVPWFVPAGGALAVFDPGDGVVDVPRLLAAYLAGAAQRGVELRWGTGVEAILTRGGRVTAVRTGRGEVSTGCVVDAAGAWAGELATRARFRDPGFVPTRRHLAVTGPDSRVRPGAPYVWDLERRFYARPEAGGLLVCACDEERDRPRDCPADPRVTAEIARKMEECLPELAPLPLRQYWAGHRTHAPAGAPWLHRDAELQGWIWAAGLGGHGVTASPAVGRRVAEAVLGSG